MRSVMTVFAVGMIGGAGVLIALPANEGTLLFPAVGAIPDPPALPCKHQAWPNADRGCLKWTARRQQPASSEPDRASDHVAAPTSMQPPATQHGELATPDVPIDAATPTIEASAERPAPSPRTAQRRTGETARKSADMPRSIAVMASASDGTRRKIVIRPTSMQDIYYYARNIAAIGPTLGR